MYHKCDISTFLHCNVNSLVCLYAFLIFQRLSHHPCMKLPAPRSLDPKLQRASWMLKSPHFNWLLQDLLLQGKENSFKRLHSSCPSSFCHTQSWCYLTIEFRCRMKTSKGSKWVQLGEATTTVIGLAEQISQKTSGFIHSSNHRDLLDIVDALRSNGVSHQ